MEKIVTTKKYGEKTFEDIKHIDEYGNEYWEARELHKTLEYQSWDKFLNVIDKAMTACSNSGYSKDYHFSQVGKMINIGKSQLEKEKKRLAVKTK